MPLGNEVVISTFKWRKCDISGKPIGISNDNPLLNMSLYEVELPDGVVEELSAKSITKKMWAHCNEEEFMYQILDKIVNHCTNGQAISTDDAYIDTPSIQKLRKTTIG